jgi:biopolymer transport protein ExbD
MKLNLGSPAEEARIEIIPLIDVIFCILTFFILAAVGLTRQSGINVDLPRASTGSSQMREMLIVSLDPIGQLYVDRNPVTEQELIRELLNYQIDSPEGLVVLYASRSASYNEVVELLDLLRSTGSDRVALATLPDGLTPDAPLDIDELLEQEFENLDQFSPSEFPENDPIPQLNPDQLQPLEPLPTVPGDRPSSGNKNP